MRLRFLPPSSSPPEACSRPDDGDAKPFLHFLQNLLGFKASVASPVSMKDSISIMDLFQPIPDALMPDVVESEEEEDTEAGSDSSSLDHAEMEDPSYEADDEREPSKRVTFYENVQVKEIPHHRSYSDEMRRDMWSSSEMTQKNVERNSIEFLVDGWNWQHATEEDNFLKLPDGELVHPATWMRSAPLLPQSRKAKRRLKQKLKNNVVEFAPAIVGQYQGLEGRCS
jgi:hypothetical protein